MYVVEEIKLGKLQINEQNIVLYKALINKSIIIQDLTRQTGQI